MADYSGNIICDLRTVMSMSMRFFYGQNIEHGFINVLFNYVIVMRYDTSLIIK